MQNILEAMFAQQNIVLLDGENIYCNKYYYTIRTLYFIWIPAEWGKSASHSTDAIVWWWWYGGNYWKHSS